MLRRRTLVAVCACAWAWAWAWAPAAFAQSPVLGSPDAPPSAATVKTPAPSPPAATPAKVRPPSAKADPAPATTPPPRVPPSAPAATQMPKADAAAAQEAARAYQLARRDAARKRKAALMREVRPVGGHVRAVAASFTPVSTAATSKSRRLEPVSVPATAATPTSINTLLPAFLSGLVGGLLVFAVAVAVTPFRVFESRRHSPTLRYVRDHRSVLAGGGAALAVTGAALLQII